MSEEHKIQNEARNALAGHCMLFRANVGQGWTGQHIMKATRVQHVALQPGDVVIRGARPFSTGLPEGFSDTFGCAKVVITPEMVGQTFARFIAVEFKAAGKKPTKIQAAFLSAVNSYGGAAGVCRSVEDAQKLVALAKSTL